MTDLRADGRSGHAAGLCMIPAANDGTKRPGTGCWLDYTKRCSTLAEIDRWFGPGSKFSGLGVVCGAVSGNLEMLEFEGRAVEEGLLEEFDKLAAAAGLAEVLRRLTEGYLETTPSGGVHLLYRCETVEGSLKFARRPATPAELEANPGDKVKVLLESRGEGGFAVTASSNGTTHPTGRPWVRVSGGFDTIPTITPDERRALHELARSFDRMPREPMPVPRTTPPAGEHWDVRPGDDWAQRTTWPQILEPHGWTRLYSARGGNEAWRRPGKDTPGLSATINEQGAGCLYVFSSSTPFEPGKAYGKLSAHVILNHDGDVARAIRGLVDQGYGAPAVKAEAISPLADRPEADDYDNLDHDPWDDRMNAKPGPSADQPADPKPKTDLFRRWTMAELLVEPDTFEWDITGMLAHVTYGQIAGEMKTLKTYVSAFIQVGLAAGVPIFGQFVPPKALPVVSYVGEGGRIPYMRRIRRIARALGVDLRDIPLTMSFETAPITSMVFQETLARDLAELEPGLVALDPLYAFHGTETRAADLHAEGSLLNAVSGPCVNAGANLLLNNHYNQTGSGTGLKRITMAGSGEHSDTWLLLAHRETPDVEAGEFKLTLDIGSRQWGGTTWDLDLSIGRFDVDTGQHDGDIRWDLKRSLGKAKTTPGGVSPKASAARVAILDVLADRPWQLTKTEVLERVGGNKETFKMAFDSLVEDGRIGHDKIGRIEAGTIKSRPVWGLLANPPQNDGRSSTWESE